MEELGGVTASETEAIGQAEAMEARFRRLEDEERAIATQNALSPEGALAAVRGELSVLQAAGVRDSCEMEAIERRLDVVTSQLSGESGEISRINEEIRGLDEEVSAFQAGYQKASRRRESDQEAWSAAEEAMTEARLAVAAAGARVDALEAALSGNVDIESRARSKLLEGALGALVSRLDIPAGLEKAVDAALGRWADAVAFQSADRLKARSRGSRREEGEASLLSPQNRGRPRPPKSPPHRASTAWWIGSGRADLGLARHLLGDVLLVEGWATALALVARHPALRAATLEGDLVSIDGVQIALPDGAGPAMLETAWWRQRKRGRPCPEPPRSSRPPTTSRRAVIWRGRRWSGSNRPRPRWPDAEAMARLQKTVDALEGERARLRERLGSIQEATAERERQAGELARRLQAVEGEEGERMRAWEELETRRIQIMQPIGRSPRSEWQEAASVQGSSPSAVVFSSSVS